MKCRIYYHMQDLDGYASQQILAKHFKSKNYEVECIPYDYHINVNFDEFTEETIKELTVVFVDVLPYQKPDYIKNLTGLFKERLVIIDHHKSSIEYLNEFLELWPDTDTSNWILFTDYAACELAYIYTIIGKVEKQDLEETVKKNYVYVPKHIKLLGRYDIHDESSEFPWKTILYFQYGMRSFIDDLCEPKDNNVFDLLDVLYGDMSDYKNTPSVKYTVTISEIIKNGIAITNYIKTRNKKILEMKSFIRVSFYSKTGKKTSHSKCYFANDIANNTKIFEDNDLYNDPEAIYVLANYNILKGIYTVSLYSTNDSKIDVSSIASIMGGGGHKHAAGFRSSYVCYNDNKNNKINVLTIK